MKSIRRYLDEIYPAVKKSYADMVKSRDEYDALRAKLAESESSEVLAQTKLSQQEFAEKANFLGALLKETPVHQMALAKAVSSALSVDFWSYHLFSYAD